MVPKQKHPPHEGTQPGLDIGTELERCVQTAVTLKRALLSAFLVVYGWIFHKDLKRHLKSQAQFFKGL